MSSTDKTGEKLLASIRKTKASGGPTETTAASGPAATPKRAKTATRKAAPKARSKAAAKPAAKRAAKPAATKPAAVAADPYQGARRVWPD